MNLMLKALCKPWIDSLTSTATVERVLRFYILTEANHQLL